MPDAHVLAVDSHPMKRKIIDLFVMGKSLREVRSAIEPKLSIDALNRYKKTYVTPALERAIGLIQVDSNDRPTVHPNPTAQPAGIPNGDPSQPADTGTTEIECLSPEQSKALQREIAVSPIAARLVSKFNKIDSGLDASHLERDWKSFAALLNADTRRSELLAKLTGELRSDESTGQNVQVNVIIPSMTRAGGESATNQGDRATDFGPRGENLLPGARVVTVDLPKK